MAKKSGLEFTGRVTGASLVKKFMEGATEAIGGLMGQAHIEDQLLKVTRQRFYPKGTNKFAQKEPGGKQWAANSPATIRNRKENKRRDQALVETGELRRSIMVLRNNLRSKSALASPSGAGAFIGINPSSPASKYARVHQFGGTTPKGARIPRRRFLGVSSKDIGIIRAFLAKSLNTALGGGKPGKFKG